MSTKVSSASSPRRLLLISRWRESFGDRLLLDGLGSRRLLSDKRLSHRLARDAEGRRREELVRDMVGKEKRIGLFGLRLCFYSIYLL